MRLIDADELNKFIDKWFSKKLDNEGNVTVCEWGNLFKKSVDAQPTAYDVDKVVKELEHTCDFTQLYKSMDEFGNYVDKEIKMIRIDNAIKIVKAGGKNDD